MRPISRWMHLMSTTVQVATVTGRNGYGKPTYGTPTSYAAHISGERSLVRDATGQQVVSRQSVHLATADAFDATAQVTLSTADVGSTESYAVHPPILAVERRFDNRGGHHVVLRLE